MACFGWEVCFPFALGVFVDDDVDDDGTSVC